MEAPRCGSAATSRTTSITDVTVGSGGTTQLNLNLDVSPSVTVRGSADSKGNTGFGVFVERDY